MSNNKDKNLGWVEKIYAYWCFSRRFCFNPKWGPFPGAIIFATFSLVVVFIVIGLCNKFLYEYYRIDITTSILVAHPEMDKLLLGAIWVLAAVIFLIYIIRFPRCKKKKVGIGVALDSRFISYTDLPNALRERKLIEIELERLIQEEGENNVFDVKVLNDYCAAKIISNANNPKFVRKFLKKSKIVFLIFGIYKKEQYDGNKKTKFYLEYVVSHRPILKRISNSLASEYSKILKEQNWIFNDIDSGTMHEAVAENINQNALFAIGTSSLFSELPDISIRYLTKLKIRNNNHPANEQKVSQYLAHAHLLAAHIILITKQSSDYLAQSVSHVEKSVGYKNNFYQAYLLLGYLYFKHKQIEKAHEAIDKAESFQYDAAWRFSKAFLFFYSDDLNIIKKGLNIYRDIKQKMLIQIDSAQYKSIEATILDVIYEERKLQYYFSLIFLYAKVYKNIDKAQDYLQQFKEKIADEKKLVFLVNEAEKMLVR